MRAPRDWFKAGETEPTTLDILCIVIGAFTVELSWICYLVLKRGN